MPPFAWKRQLAEYGLPRDERERIERALSRLNSAGFDDFGVDPDTLKATLAAMRWFYRTYFRVDAVGLERVPEGRALLVANHGGQVPIDGMLVAMAMILEGEPPRLTRGMVERWFPSIPFISTLFVRCGQMVGDHRNCRTLLEREECVLVFPEGLKGIAKSYRERYQLQRFGTGFVRLALETRTPIVPVAVIGCEEAYPAIAKLEGPLKRFGIPHLPITPFFPLFGPLGALPLPTRVTLRFGEPIRVTGDPDASDAEIEGEVQRVKSALQTEINAGLAKRGKDIFGGSGR